MLQADPTVVGFQKEEKVMTHFTGWEKKQSKTTAEPNVNLTADCSIPAGWRDLLGGNLLSFTLIHAAAIFTFTFRAELGRACLRYRR